MKETFARIRKVILHLLISFQQEIKYLFFGVLTTFVNVVCFAVFLPNSPTAGQLTAATWGAWFVSVLFAYVTNRRWVFESKAAGAGKVFREGLSFFGARLLSGGVDYLIVALLIWQLGWNEIFSKLLSNVVVIVLNYVLSRWVVFRTPSEVSQKENRR